MTKYPQFWSTMIVKKKKSKTRQASMTEISTILVNSIAIVARANPKKWAGSAHSTMMDLEIDSRGEVGETFLADALIQLGHEVEVDRTTDAGSKPWDLRVDGNVLIEVKTATLGKSNAIFQHERIIQGRGWDALALVDIAPDDVYLTLAAKQTIPFRRAAQVWTKHPKKLHLRGGGGDYKWDLTLNDVANRRLAALGDIEEHYQALLKELRRE